MIAIAAMIAAAAVPFIGKFQQTQTLKSLSEDIMHTLILAQSNAVNGDQRSRWGVRILSGTYVMYAGASYATRLPARDEAHEILIPITARNQKEFTFEGTHGRAVRSGILQLTDPQLNTVKIQANALGGISLAL